MTSTIAKLIRVSVLAVYLLFAGLNLPVDAQTETGTISGYVYQSDGASPILSDAWVVIEMFDGGHQRIVAVEPDGSYSVGGLTEGLYRARAYAEGHTREWYPNAVMSGQPITTLSILPGTTIPNVNFTLDPGGMISGTVWSQDGTAGVPNMRVELEGRWAGTCTDEQGQYTFYGVPLDTPLTLQTGGINWCGGGVNDYPMMWWQTANTYEAAQRITLTSQTPNVERIDFGVGAMLDATVMLQGRPPQPHPDWMTRLRVKITLMSGGAPIFDNDLMTADDGSFIFAGLTPGAYRIWVKGERSLANAVVVDLGVGSNLIDLGILREGDANGDNTIGLVDFSLLAASFAKEVGESGYDARADFNGDGRITLPDFSLMASNYGQAGEPS